LDPIARDVTISREKKKGKIARQTGGPGPKTKRTGGGRTKTYKKMNGGGLLSQRRKKKKKKDVR